MLGNNCGCLCWPFCRPECPLQKERTRLKVGVSEKGCKEWMRSNWRFQNHSFFCCCLELCQTYYGRSLKPFLSQQIVLVMDYMARKIVKQDFMFFLRWDSFNSHIHPFTHKKCDSHEILHLIFKGVSLWLFSYLAHWVPPSSNKPFFCSTHSRHQNSDSRQLQRSWIVVEMLTNVW